MATHHRKNLTDRTLKALKPAEPGKRYEIIDTVQPALAIRVTSSGAKSFCLRSRFPGSPHFTRKALGAYPTLDLAGARQKAREWLLLISKGVNPEIEAERARQEELRKQKHTFASVAEEFIDKVVIGPDPQNPHQRQARQTAQYIRGTLIPRWGKHPIADVDDVEIRAFLDERRETPAHARNLLVKLRCLFSWAIETRRFGLKVSPCDNIRIKTLIGEVKTRDRILTDEEIAAFWRATNSLNYPARDLFRILLLTGLRLNEAAKATWNEIDFTKREWTVPANRMKGKNGKAKAHVLPLTSDMLSILNQLPRFEDGDFVFSHRFGAKPSTITDKVKKRLDAAMLVELRKDAEQPKKVKLAPWVNHDLRRSVRSRMSGLGISHEAAEAVLAHVRPGIARRYDHHDYSAEKRDALEKWHVKLREIVEPPKRAGNVIRLARI